jgi:hypothetical protein
VAIAHDALLAPVILLAGYASRWSPRPALLRAALAVAGAAAIVALPAVAGFGRRPDNPSILPQAYGRHLLAIFVTVALITTAVGLLSAYAPSMGKAILSIVGVLLAIWLVFMVIGMIISALKFLIWLGFLAIIAAIVVTLISKMAKS